MSTSLKHLKVSIWITCLTSWLRSCATLFVTYLLASGYALWLYGPSPSIVLSKMTRTYFFRFLCSDLTAPKSAINCNCAVTASCWIPQFGVIAMT
ncbi:hypothetical protein B0H14DRAFT_444472 [Mycena olivaceomarginata]|nr:hypothetical protein B0H14DRAFT_444472 [Mycena olivaceomarginata]